MYIGTNRCKNWQRDCFFLADLDIYKSNIEIETLRPIDVRTDRETGFRTNLYIYQINIEIDTLGPIDLRTDRETIFSD